jgi:hypothetical protein
METPTKNKVSVFDRLRMSNHFESSLEEPPEDMSPVAKYEPIWDNFDFKTADELLTRDWFVDEDSIRYIIYYANQEAWEFIYANRRKYSRRIREIIEPHDYQVSPEKLRFKVRCVSDKEWNEMIRESQRKLDDKFEVAWTKYSESVPDRPLREIDSLLDDAWDRLVKTKDKLTKYLSSRSKAYVPPSMRGKKEPEDPRQTVIENEIRAMENEYDKIQKLVEEIDSAYWETQKNDYRKKWVPSLSS